MPKRYTAEQAAHDARRTVDRVMGRNVKKPQCVCKNHMGTSKQKHKTEAAALKAIADRLLRPGATYSVYRCPTSQFFHVTSRPRRES